MDIPIEIVRTFDETLDLYDLTDPETPEIEHLALYPGQEVKLITESNPSAWGRYDLDSSEADNLVDITYQYTTRDNSGISQGSDGNGGVDEWIITANNAFGSGTIVLKPSFTRPGPWEERYKAFEIDFKVQNEFEYI